MYAAIAVGLGFIVGLAFAMPLLELMASMVGLPYLVAISPMECFSTYMRVALYVGFALATSVLVYQLVRFLTPGLTR